MSCGVWESEVDYGSISQRAAEGWDFYIGQIEGPDQYERVVQSVPAFRRDFPDFKAAIVTNMGGFEENYPGAGAEKARPLIDAGFACICEGHVKEDGVDPRQRVDYAKRVLGWPEPQPMAGLGNGASLADYPGLENEFGWSVFAAEYIYKP